jgi:hypothetical protein
MIVGMGAERLEGDAGEQGMIAFGHLLPAQFKPGPAAEWGGIVKKEQGQ